VRRTRIAIIALSSIVTIISLRAKAEELRATGHWVSAWSTAVHAPLPFPGLPPAIALENQTVRMVVKPTLGGERLRIRLSNAFGNSALTIGSVHVALAKQGPEIVAGSDRNVTFAGNASVTIPPGAPVLSDPVELKVPAFTEIAVSLYLPSSVSGSSMHFWAQHDTYISGTGNFSDKEEIPNASARTSWYWLSDVEVWAADDVAAVVALGDSITDGVGAKQGEYSDWPDILASRLSAEGKAKKLAVINEGIGGNRILHDGAGVSALARLDRDVLAQPGVVSVILLEGINDIGWPHLKPKSPDGTTPKEPPFASEAVSADDLIGGQKQIIGRAHEHGIRVYGATLTPFEGADYYSTEGEAMRQKINQWIRTGGAFDGVFDFDAAVRDPNHPSQFRDGYHSGDHLHPSATGFKAMADAVDLTMLRSAVSSSTKK
jgi:lysophospholipase L1-like esterase